MATTTTPASTTPYTAITNNCPGAVVTFYPGSFPASNLKEVSSWVWPKWGGIGAPLLCAPLFSLVICIPTRSHKFYVTLYSDLMAKSIGNAQRVRRKAWSCRNGSQHRCRSRHSPTHAWMRSLTGAVHPPTHVTQIWFYFGQVGQIPPYIGKLTAPFTTGATSFSMAIPANMVVAGGSYRSYVLFIDTSGREYNTRTVDDVRSTRVC